MQFLGTSPVLLAPLNVQVQVPSEACVHTIEAAGSFLASVEEPQWTLDVMVVTLQLLLFPEPLAPLAVTVLGERSISCCFCRANSTSALWSPTLGILTRSSSKFPLSASR